MSDGPRYTAFARKQGTSGGALFSKCMKYRYALWRRWHEGPLIAFIGLNPSTADETADDPTIRRCMGFAKLWGGAGIWMFNLFAFRATDPDDMKAADDPIGPGNDAELRRLADGSYSRSTIIACWGNHGSYLGRSVDVRKLLVDAPLDCFGLTKADEPKHPLYLRRNAPIRFLDQAGQSP